MKPCEVFREALVDLHYGLLNAAAERNMRRHVDSCPGCAAELASLARLAGALAPEAGDAFGREAEIDWDRFAAMTARRAVAAASREEPAPSGLAGWLASWRLPIAPGWARAAAMAGAVLVLVIGLSLMSYNSAPVPVAPADRAAEVIMPEANLDNLTVNLARENTAEYLRQTRAVLVSMMDVDVHCEKDRVDISAERAKAGELLRRQRLIATELHRMPLARAQDVCDDLEKLLLEVASLGDCAHDEDVKTIRDLVEKRQILVRMELLGQELAKRGGTNA